MMSSWMIGNNAWVDILLVLGEMWVDTPGSSHPMIVGASPQTSR
jgi:hypothetical protein